MDDGRTTGTRAASRIMWQVKDKDGNVVREGESLVNPEGIVSYDQLSDLPAGIYQIVSGPVQIPLKVIEGGRA